MGEQFDSPEWIAFAAERLAARQAQPVGPASSRSFLDRMTSSSADPHAARAEAEAEERDSKRARPDDGAER